MTPRTLTFAGVEYHLPFADLIRAHTDKERAALVASVDDAGVVIPIVTYDRMADGGGGLGVIDGATRLSIAVEKELASVPVEHLGALSEDHARALCLTLNSDRRQLSAAEQSAARKQRVALAVELKEAGLSTRQIAKGLGISQAMVVKDLGVGQPSQTADKSEHRLSDTDQNIKVIHSIVSDLRRLQGKVETLEKGPFAKHLTRLLDSHNAECALESLIASFNDLTAAAMQPEENEPE